jgi:hypothetical protein
MLIIEKKLRNIILGFLFLCSLPASAMSCFQYEDGSELYSSFVEDVFKSLPSTFKETICRKSVSIKVRNKIILDQIDGWAPNALSVIYLKEKTIGTEYGKMNLIHELAHIFKDRNRDLFDKNEFSLKSRRTRNGLLVKIDHKRDHSFERSYDRYEFKNKSEFFAVNSELFFTKQDFKCKRPVQYEYLASIYNFKPFEVSVCKTVSMLPLGFATGKFVDLDWNQFYGLDFLLASEGKDVSSRFGHAMLRLVFCKPTRKEKSNECYKDHGYHYVISYRAAVNDESVRMLYGLTGQYPSKAFLLPLSEVIDQYTKNEKRQLTAIPLRNDLYRLSELRDLVYDQVWSYKGKYKFFTNNCGTETLSFLQTIINNSDIFKLRSISPVFLAKKIVEKNLNVTGIDNQDLVFLPSPSTEEELLSILSASSIDFIGFRALSIDEKKNLIDHSVYQKVAALWVLQSKHVAKLELELLLSLSKTKNKKVRTELDRVSKVFEFSTVDFKGIPTSEEFLLIKKEIQSVDVGALKKFAKEIEPQLYQKVESEKVFLNAIKLSLIEKGEL